ncbi:MAG: DUF3795 domain-containing protein [Clostridia bacterium]|nr:DUF3795 domain-containing protein [Clostridia bacterium]
MESLTYCGLDCSKCDLKTVCAGCVASNGMPFGGTCVAAECIKRGGKEAYAALKTELLSEINALLPVYGAPAATELHELSCKYVNLAYPLESGETARFLDDKKICLGTQIKQAGEARCFGVLADASFILLCTYGAGGADPKLLLYKQRDGKESEETGCNRF